MLALSAKEIGYLRDHFGKCDRKLALLPIPGGVLSRQLIKYSKKIHAGREGMFVCSKLTQNLSEMEIRTFLRIQRVIWDHLLPFKGEIQLEASFIYFRIIIIALLCCLLCFFFHSLFQPAEFIFSSKSHKESSEKMFPFKVQFLDHNSEMF